MSSRKIPLTAVTSYTQESCNTITVNKIQLNSMQKFKCPSKIFFFYFAVLTH